MAYMRDDELKLLQSKLWGLCRDLPKHMHTAVLIVIAVRASCRGRGRR